MNSIFAKKIEDWYLENKRDLPWRETKDPYQIWVSEIILQQTRVAQGMDYFYRFIHRFPDVASLAAADEDEVLRLWQGLGYYSRARNMHKAARQVMENGGNFPDVFEEVRSLAGIGGYTASAIMSFAYNQPYAVLDGNVYRILARTQGVSTPIDSTSGKKIFTQLAQELLDRHNPSLYNSAIMDFGALQCTPKGCDCPACPLCLDCVARQENRVDELPVKGHKTAVKTRHLIYINVREEVGERMLLHRREKGDIWEGLYELPLVEVTDDCGQVDLSSLPWIKAMMASGATLTCMAKEVKHQLTHQKLLTDYYELRVPFDLQKWQSMKARDYHTEQYIVAPVSNLDNYGMPKLILQLLAIT